MIKIKERYLKIGGKLSKTFQVLLTFCKENSSKYFYAVMQPAQHFEFLESNCFDLTPFSFISCNFLCNKDSFKKLKYSKISALELRYYFVTLH